jgi:ubiquinone/menaquinone biosynthesis C-methylase UbiE
MRVITQEAARKKLWESSTTKEVKRLFDGMAGDWSETRNVPTRKIPIVDALARGGAFGNTAIDLGAGTGLATQVLAEHFKKIAAIDLSIEMLKNSVSDLKCKMHSQTLALTMIMWKRLCSNKRSVIDNKNFLAMCVDVSIY